MLTDYTDLYERMGSRSAGAPPPRVGATPDDPVSRAARIRALGAGPATTPAGSPVPVKLPSAPWYKSAGRFLGAAGAVLGVGDAVRDTAAVAGDPASSALDVVASGAGGAGRLAAAGAGAAGGAKAGAALGAMTGPLAPILAPAGALVGAGVGGFIGYKGADAAISAARAPAAPAPVQVPEISPTVSYQVGADEPVAAVAPATAPVAAQPPAAQVVDRSTVPYQPLATTTLPDGTISITGAGQSPDYLRRRALARGAQEPVSTPVGRFFGATMELKKIASDNAAKQAKAKAEVEGLVKLSSAAKDSAEADRARFGLAAAREHLKVNPTDFAGAAAAAGLRASSTSGRFSVPLGAQPTDISQGVNVVNNQTGQVTTTKPVRQASAADFEQDVKRLGKAATLELYKERGIRVPAN